ncbi:long-chain fatty acid--CoA ligase [Streptomyces dangxiongensis]|uniref:Long-chain fatty acid--CoA ligase n=1 Tax=Streptomyces dangxiongensis TaxID=1442032 RepID=A0A3G2JAS9_9ACTN|nr:AMP-binding protein [Streptomyces dangxiongensis]AYN39413.1 long-chain fatty acid--CoA ligase [Streptomyces dangxiongensis]
MPSGPAVSSWSADRSVPLFDRSVGALLREAVAAHPDTVALVSVPDGGGPRQQWTYRELLAEAESVAAGLLQRVDVGDKVAVWAPNVARWPVFAYAAALAGVTLVTLNPALRPDGLEHALRASGAVLLVHAERSRDHDMAAVVREVAPRLPGLRHIVPFGAWDTLRASGPLPSDEEVRAVPAQLQFTSGTTGTPKAVLLSHRAVVNVARLTFEGLGVARGVTVVSPLPMFHTAGCVISTLGPLWSGGTFVLLERFHPLALLEVLRERPGALLTSVPTVLTALCEVAAGREPRPVLSAVLTGAAPVRAQLIRETEELFSTTVFNLYGQTELASVLTLTRPEDSAELKTTTVGRPLPHAEVRIVDPGTGEVQPLGVQGEICARGYQRMLGYHGDEEATARKVDADGWLHTGDLGSMGADGTLRVAGRLDDLIIRGGENISPAAIEELLCTVPEVRDAVVVGVPDEKYGEVVAAVLQPAADGPDPDAGRVLAECARRLPPHMVPAALYLAGDLPLTSSGKVQRFRVRELAVAGLLRPLTTRPVAAARG